MILHFKTQPFVSSKWVDRGEFTPGLYTTLIHTISFYPFSLYAGDGLLTIQEVAFAMDGRNSQTEVQKFLRTINCPVLNSLASGDQTKTIKAFKKIDTGNEYVLSMIDLIMISSSAYCTSSPTNFISYLQLH